MASAAFPSRPAAFGKHSVLALVLIGTLAFIALLYFIGTDRMGGNANNGQAHAASRGLTGYAALVRLLEADPEGGLALGFELLGELRLDLGGRRSGLGGCGGSRSCDGEGRRGHHQRQQLYQQPAWRPATSPSERPRGGT